MAEDTGKKIVDEYDINTQGAQKGIKALGDSVDQAEKSTGGFRSKLTSLSEGLSAAGDASEPLLLGLQDLPENLAGGVAGIGTFVTAIGTGGLAGVVTTAAVGVFTLWQNWDKVVESFTGSTEPVGEVKDRVSELESELEKLKEKRLKLEVDDQEVQDAEDKINRLRAALDEVKALEETPTEIESAQSAAVREATRAGGYIGPEGVKTLIQEVMRAAGNQPLGEASKARQEELDAEQKDIDAQQAFYDSLSPAYRLAKHQDDINARQAALNKKRADEEAFQKTQEQDARELIGLAQKGQSEPLDQLQRMAKTGAFNDSFAKAIGAADWKSQRDFAEVQRRQAERKEELERERAEQERAREDRERVESTLQAKRDAEFLGKVREGRPVPEEDRRAYLRPDDKDHELRQSEFDDARREFEEKSRKESEAKADRDREKVESEAEAQRKAQVQEAVALNQKFIPNIEYAMARSGGLPTPQIHAKTQRDLRALGIDPSIAGEVSGELQEQALRELRAANAAKQAMGLSSQQAFAATILDLAKQIQDQARQGAEVRQQLWQARSIIRETRQSVRPNGPSHLPYFN